MWKYLCLSTAFLYTLSASAQLHNKLDSLLRQQLPGQPGFALLIEQAGKSVYDRQAGLADLLAHKKINRQANFRMASITKQFTAMGILLLQKEKKLSVNDPVGKWLPELPAGIGKSIRISHLLTHSSGILDYEELMDTLQTTQLLDKDVLRLLQWHDTTYFTPGTAFRYSNSGFCLLALIIERASHQPYASFIHQNIFMPLHMDASVVYEAGKPLPDRAMGYAKDSAGRIVFSDQSVTSATKGDGGVYTSIEDYSKWIHAIQRSVLLNVPRVMRQVHFPAGEVANSFYSSGWFYTVASPAVWFHSGSTCGFNNYVITVPSKKLSIIFFSNLADNATLFREILLLLHQYDFEDYTGLFALHELTR